MEVSLSRRERERLVRRQAILAAAKAVFAERGYQNATLEEIAQRAEFGKGTLYNYFEGGKEGLLFAILDELHDDLYDLIQETFSPERQAGRPFRAVFHGLVIASFRFFQERQHLFMILMKELHWLMFAEDQEKAAYFKRQQERIVHAMEPMLQAAMQRGEIRALPPQAVAHTIIGNIKGIQMHNCLVSRDPLAETAVSTPEKAADFLTTMLLDGLLTRPGLPLSEPR